MLFVRLLIVYFLWIVQKILLFDAFYSVFIRCFNLFIWQCELNDMGQWYGAEHLISDNTFSIFKTNENRKPEKNEGIFGEWQGRGMFLFRKKNVQKNLFFTFFHSYFTRLARFCSYLTAGFRPYRDGFQENHEEFLEISRRVLGYIASWYSLNRVMISSTRHHETA